MKLYYIQGTSSLVVRIIIHEMNLTCSFEAVDFMTRKTETGKDFLKINPKGYVPTLETNDGIILTETALILQYLADENAALALLPEIRTLNRYRILEWLNFIATELHKVCVLLIHSPLPEEAKSIMVKSSLKERLSVINEHLADKKYLVGEQFTLADAYLFAVLFWLPNVFKVDLSPWPNLITYFSNLKDRPSIQKTFKEEKIELK